MRAAVIQHQATQGVVAQAWEFIEDWRDTLSPGPQDVVIRTEASALNQMDLWVSRGVPGLELDYPRVSGCDACGVVEAVGEDVESAWIGKRVVFNAAMEQPTRIRPGDPTGAHLAPQYKLLGEHFNGAHRERFLAPVANVQPVGDADPVGAAAFGLVSLTAYGMIRKARLRPGQIVLITGIGGGVATAALALCKWMGCRVAVTSRHQWKLDRALELGAEHAILDDGEDWSRLVRAWTSKRGVDVVIDSVGAPIHASCLASMGRGGCFVTCGATAGPSGETHLGRIFWNQLRVLGSTMGSSDEFAEVVALFNAGLIEPVVDSVHDAANVRDAIARLESAEQFGKIVLRWSKATGE